MAAELPTEAQRKQRLHREIIRALGVKVRRAENSLVRSVATNLCFIVICVYDRYRAVHGVLDRAA